MAVVVVVMVCWRSARAAQKLPACHTAHKRDIRRERERVHERESTPPGESCVTRAFTDEHWNPPKDSRTRSA